MNWHRVAIVFKKDLWEVKDDKTAMVPLVVLPLLLCVILPLLVVCLGSQSIVVNGISGVSLFAKNARLPFGVHGIPQRDQVVYMILMYFFAPMFLLIPVMVSNVVASSSFVGEKIAKTIEGLLYTPVTNRELIFGKILAALIPSIAVTWLSFICYGVILDVYSIQEMGFLIFPNAIWLLMCFALVPLVAFLSTALVIAVSQRVKSEKSAQSISMLIILPVLGVLVSQASGIFEISVMFSLLCIAVLAVADVCVFLFIVRKFNREKFLLEK